jgi:hypothetical protein
LSAFSQELVALSVQSTDDDTRRRLSLTSFSLHFLHSTFHKQGIDLEAGGRNKTKHRTAPKSENVYLKLLVKVRRMERERKRS